MANNCYNLISFFGNDAVLEQVKKWRLSLDKLNATNDDDGSVKAINQIFYPKIKPKDIDYGSKWIYMDDTPNTPSEYQLGITSAWSSPDLFLERLASLLYKYDPNVVVENRINNDDGSLGFRYITPYDESKFYVQRFDGEVDYDSYDEPEEAEEAAEEVYREFHLEYLTDLMMDRPNTFDVIKSFMPNLNVDWKEIKAEIDRPEDEDF